MRWSRALARRAEPVFGVAVARLDQVTAAEKERYESLYCGLCRTLKERYGQAPRACLSYDLTFLAMLRGSLDEGPEETGIEKCASHPIGGRPYARCAAMSYAADLSVAFAYHKCLDDVADDASVAARGAERLLAGPYERARGHIPDACQAIEEAMAAIRAIERDAASEPDDAADAFGNLLGTLFARKSGFWAPHLERLGRATGRVVYLMDAAVDLPKDERSGSYNPFAGRGMSPQELRCLLASEAHEMACAFDVLPLERDAHLLESVVYSGIWQKFNAIYSDASSDQEDAEDAQ